MPFETQRQAGEEAGEIVKLRPANPDDEEFLLTLYTAGRHEELARVGWGAEEIKAFCKMQLTAQNWHHGLRYPAAEDCIVMKGDQPVGRLKVYERPEEILLVDIALISEVQRQGIGTYLLRTLMSRARATSKPLRLHVLFTSPGLQLYQKLGFSRVADDDTYIEMEYSPESESC